MSDDNTSNEPVESKTAEDNTSNSAEPTAVEPAKPDTVEETSAAAEKADAPEQVSESEAPAADGPVVERVYDEETGKWVEKDPSGDGDEDGSAKKKGKKNAMDQKQEKRPMVSVGQLFRFADACDGFLIFIGLVGAIGVGGALPGFSFLFGDLLNNLNDPAAIQEVALTFLYLGCGMFAGGFLRVFGLSASAKRQTHRFRMEYLKQMLRQDVAWHDKIQGKEFTSKLADATTKFEAGISTKFAEAATYISAFLVGIVIGFVRSWKLTLVILSLLPLAAILGAMFGKVMAGAAAAGAKSYAAAGGVAEESIASIRTVTSLNAQGTAFTMYSRFLDAAQKSGVRSSINGGGLFGVFNLFMYGAYGLAFWYGSKLVSEIPEGATEPELQGGDVLTVFFCVLFGAMMIGQAGPAIQSVQEAQAVAHEAYEVIDRIPEVDIEDTSGTDLTTCKGHVEFRGVEFAYPSRPDAQVLKGISFEVAPGTSTALVGGSGCGKSTCMALLQRFYEPNGGAVLVDGADIKTLNLASLRKHIGIVSQEPTLFATTIMNNIKFGAGADAEPSDEQVIDAAKAANIHDFISSLPLGYDTSVGDQGIQLSGGQKQRVAIARALLRNPTILLLDEATSALDTQSERIVQEALDNLMESRTTIMIAHRLSTVRKANQIIVMEAGTIIECGTHDELAASDGTYAELARLQALKERTSSSNGESPSKSAKTDTNEVDELIADPQEKEKSPEELKKEAKEQKKQQQAKMAEWNQRLFAMSFKNGCEWFKLILACLMAALNGAVLPVFAILFSDMLAIFFQCTPIDLVAIGCNAVNATLNETVYGCDLVPLNSISYVTVSSSVCLAACIPSRTLC